jgi:hypothetical protein
MATTTNYGWTTPDDTALVKDGAAAIRTLGSSVDTTTKALNPSTTLGDIEYRSSTANTNTRLGIGSNGQYLTVSGGVPAWGSVSAGGMTLLSTTTLSGATTTISSIDGTYTNLMGVVFGVTNVTSNNKFRCAPNASTSITTQIRNDSDSSISNTNDSYMLFNSLDVDRANSANSWSFTIYNYASTTSRKPFNISGSFVATSVQRPYFASGHIGTTSAITSLVFSNQGGNLDSGTVLLYGVK